MLIYLDFALSCTKQSLRICLNYLSSDDYISHVIANFVYLVLLLFIFV